VRLEYRVNKCMIHADSLSFLNLVLVLTITPPSKFLHRIFSYYTNTTSLSTMQQGARVTKLKTTVIPLELGMSQLHLGELSKDQSNVSETQILAPVQGKNNVLITAALPYVNNVPHLGNIIGCILSADVFARYCKLRGYPTLFICGTDEYGTATETKALEEKVSCQELCDRYFKLHDQIYKWFEISTDFFGRSATEKQTQITQDIFGKLNKNGYVFDDSMEQLYCEQCARFLADRFVEGTCPMCGYHDARGDQCDGCGKLINAVELVKPRCKLDGAQPHIKSSRHLFLDLPKLQASCDAFVDEASKNGGWSQNSIDITKGWINRGLNPRCITRDLKWGTPVPLDGMRDKVFYVWFDACIGYISITANYFIEKRKSLKQDPKDADWEAWWKNPSQVKLYQFMGKDNVPFHTVVFPSSLIGSGDEYTMLHHISTTEFLNYEDGKFSKSRGIGVFGNHAAETGIPVSVWRYYLLVNRPEASDTVFSWEDLLQKNNGDLLGNLGNFVNRVLKFAQKNYNSTMPPLTIASDPDAELDDASKSFINSVQTELDAYIESLENVKIKAGLRAIMAISGHGNSYLTVSNLTNSLFEQQPRHCANVIHIAINSIYLIGTLLSPYLPSTSAEILRQLNCPSRHIPTRFDPDDIQEGHVFGEPGHLFKRLDTALIAQLRLKYSGKQSQDESRKSK
jgi:methionyl-tRNA synthetase